MLLTALVTITELECLVESLTPACVTIDERRGRVVKVGPPKVELVPGRGIRLRGDAHITWDFAGVPIPVTVNAWLVVFVPHIASHGRSHVLAFEAVLEDFDVKLVPGFVDEKIAAAIQDAIAEHRDRLAWDFARTLSKRLPLPEMISPAKTFEILAVGGDVSISPSELLFAVRFEARFSEGAAGAEIEREPAPAAVPMTQAHAAAR